MKKSFSNRPLGEKNNNSGGIPPGLSIIDPQWELLDPTPNIYDLFSIFNDQYFWGSLGCVRVEWSPRMTTCAGICYFQGMGGVRIGLSKPLLKLRPRKDLVETLLHEMIHAYLFVTLNFRDRDDHGPEFKKHMHRINEASGALITVYHSFHDEVSHYKVHWWRCDGPCRERTPFFGIIKRATNRAPGPNDRWWEDHKMNCNGEFIKIKEPEGFQAKPKKETDPSKPKFPAKGAGGALGSSGGGGGGTKTLARGSGSKTIVTRNPNFKDVNALSSQKVAHNVHGFASISSSSTSPNPPSNGKQTTLNSYFSPPSSGSNIQRRPLLQSYPAGPPKSLVKSNISTFGSLSGTSSTYSSSGSSALFGGAGHILGGSRPPSQSVILSSQTRSQPTVEIPDQSEQDFEADPAKKVSCPICNRSIPFLVMNAHVDECLGSSGHLEISDDETEGARALDRPVGNLLTCPSCLGEFSEENIHAHLDSCLSYLAD